MKPLRPWMWTLVTVLLGVGLYAVAGFVRSEQLADFEVYRTAASRALAAQPLYHSEELPYQQYKYLPAFALAMVPFAWLPKELAEGLWFALSVGMAAWFMRLSLLALPDRRIAGDALVWLGLLVTAKFFQRELGFGQTNLLLGIVLLGAVLTARRGRHVTAGLLVGVGVFIKPYALVLVPWLLWVAGPGAIAAFAGVMVVGLIVPAAVYGWAGNLDLLMAWYRAVTGTTEPLLTFHENISFASMWAKWLRPHGTSPLLTVATSAIAIALVGSVVLNRRRVATPDCLEYGLLALLVPLLSPQGWDYVLLLVLPGYLCLVDRWGETPWPWRTAMIGGLAVTSFATYDFMGPPLYMFVFNNALPTVGAAVLLVCLVRLRWRALA
jgi:hypothetical protein